MKIRTDVAITTDSKIYLEKITKFWNKTSPAWRAIWGIHLHHGYFEHNETKAEAQEKLLDKLIALLPLKQQCKILDVGCGMGGSSLFLAKKFQAEVTGITLSSKQIAIAKNEACKDPVADVSFLLEDAHHLTNFSNETFDLVWSLESCEQFYNKPLFMQQAHRVLKNNGYLLLATWCTDQEEFTGKLAKEYLKICRAFDTPYMPTITYYENLLKQQNFVVEKCCDWSQFVAKSWRIGIADMCHYPWYKLLRFVNFKQLYFLSKLKLMQQWFEQGHIRYGVFVVKKKA